ncbi:hypothetical protein [Erythrobacter sp. CCH5-A1]|uniref:hypothetical protein n=1 Tax=Erythrobacter sp. CCH5-A1 TaxID=1768792 RepID=UPI000830DAD8|nr:hypothetical protein [Erythrobacter sp. CCH5-A1]
MLTPLLAAALAIQTAPESPVPATPEGNEVVTIDLLPLEHAAAARCAVAFATVSRWQREGDARGAGYPDIAATGGREFFVRVMAKIMEDTGLGREDVIALTTRAADDNEAAGGAERVKAIMPACVMMKSAAGL